MITTYNNPLRNFWDIWNNKSLRNFGIVGFSGTVWEIHDLLSF
jgi:hypothetical protein